MAPSDKPEFPPLLPLGLHSMTLADVRNMCVSAFSPSTTREEIMDGLETLVTALANVRVPAEVWIDGSFLTQKTNPEDVDLALCMRGEAYDYCTDEQRNTVDVVSQVDLKPPLHCDSYVFFEYPESHPLYWDGQWNRAYWIKQFGFSRGEERKGIAMVDIT